MFARLRYKCFILIMLLLLAVLSSGCSGAKQADLPSNVKAPGMSGTKTITDCAGHQVEIPAHVERIGCLYAFSGHVMAMLEKGQEIVAVVDGLKRDVLLTEMCPNIKNALVPSSSGAVNVEELAKAAPDIVFVKSDTAQSEGEAEKLQKIKIPYLVVDYRNIKEQQYAIEMIGQVVGAADKAGKYNDYYQQCIDRVQARLKDLPLKDRVRVFHSVNEATRTDTADTLPADWLKTVAAIDVSVYEKLKLVEGKYFASLEQIFLWDPDVITVNEPGVAGYIMNNTQWSTLRAVKDRKVYQMPLGISRWGHPGSLETPLAILWTAKTLYPDRFTDLDMVAETKTFYKEFFHCDLTDDVVNKILSGNGMRTLKHESETDKKN